MKSSINLLPTELAPKSELVKIANFIKLVGFAGIVVFLVVFAIGVGIFFLIRTQIETSGRKISELKGQVTRQERTEQGLVLLKDRIGKVKVVRDSDIENKLTKLERLTISLPNEITFSKVTVGEDKSEIAISAPNSIALTVFLNNLISLNLFEGVKLKSLSFVAARGYEIDLEVF
ncbi:hypothetical protein HY008_03330 [Candidatus Woesebacteria bacterium]|nr:hypothetical protein [Candidatus Woesebacteria bacterium]